MTENGSAVFYHLITDTGFRNWVQSPDEQSDYFWKKWIEEHPESISDLKKAREFIERLHFKESQLPPEELDALLGKVISREDPVGPGLMGEEPGRRNKLRHWQMAAAVLLLCAFSVPMVIRNIVRPEREPLPNTIEWVTVATKNGQRSKINLPDGSSVELNCQSTLRYPRSFEGDRREVELTGEAFFEVVHNDSLPFIVRANGVETEVLGTSFDVRSYPGDETTDVSLITGKVKVIEIARIWSIGVKYLDPGEQMTYLRSSGKMITRPFEPQDITAWKDGIIVFHDASFGELVRQLERWYGVDFQVYGTPRKEWKVNGRYRDEKLENILVGLKFIYGLEYKIQGKNVILKLG